MRFIISTKVIKLLHLCFCMFLFFFSEIIPAESRSCVSQATSTSTKVRHDTSFCGAVILGQICLCCVELPGKSFSFFSFTFQAVRCS